MPSDDHLTSARRHLVIRYKSALLPIPANTPAFTLVELLVVIGIVALLISILLPALAASRRQARSAVCLSNLRQLNIAFNMYLYDSKQKSLYYSGAIINNDPNRDVDWVADLLPYYKAEIIRACPEARDIAADPGAGITAINFGTATKSWSARFHPYQTIWATGSYTFNGWLYRKEPLIIAVLSGEGVINVSTGLWELPGRESTTVPLFSDGMWFTGWPQPSDVPPTNVYAGDINNAEEMQRVCLQRHKRSINVGYLDGHAGSVVLQDLWKQKWRSDWVTPSILPVVKYR